MPNLRVLLSFAVPTVTALIGILWIFRRKSNGTRKAIKPPERLVFSETAVKNGVRQEGRNVSDSRDQDWSVEDSPWQESKSPWQENMGVGTESSGVGTDISEKDTDIHIESQILVDSPVIMHSAKPSNISMPVALGTEDVHRQNVYEMDLHSLSITSSVERRIEPSPKVSFETEAFVQKVEPLCQSIHFQKFEPPSPAPDFTKQVGVEQCSMVNLEDTDNNFVIEENDKPELDLSMEPIVMDTESREMVAMETESMECVTMNTAVVDLNAVPVSANVEKEIIAKTDQSDIFCFITDEQENEADKHVKDLKAEKESSLNRSVVDLTEDSYIDLTNDDSRTECNVPVDNGSDWQTIGDNTNNNQNLEAVSSLECRIDNLSNSDITQIEDLSSGDIAQQLDHKQKHFNSSSENSPCDNVSEPCDDMMRSQVTSSDGLLSREFGMTINLKKTNVMAQNMDPTYIINNYKLEASNDSGKGASVTESTSLPTVDEEQVYEFSIPSEYCGLLIGSKGKTIKTIKEQSGTRIQLRNNPFTPGFQICVIEGPQSSVENALHIIQRRFPPGKFPGLDLCPINQEPVVQPQPNTVLMPEIMQLTLPEGVSLDIVVSSIVDAGHIFVQQPTHPTFPSLDRLNQFMLACYSQPGAVPDLPQPIEVGVICAAPMLNGWYRAQIMAVYEEMNECDVKYVDYGGYSRIQSSMLKQIRSDFMMLPFQAVECYMANVTPLQNENYFSPEAAAVLEDLTQGKLLQAQVCGRSDDGIPYIHIYQINGPKAVFVNRELVNHGVTRWIEILS